MCLPSLLSPLLVSAMAYFVLQGHEPLLCFCLLRGHRYRILSFFPWLGGLRFAAAAHSAAVPSSGPQMPPTRRVLTCSLSTASAEAKWRSWNQSPYGPPTSLWVPINNCCKHPLCRRCPFLGPPQAQGVDGLLCLYCKKGRPKNTCGVQHPTSRLRHLEVREKAVLEYT